MSAERRRLTLALLLSLLMHTLLLSLTFGDGRLGLPSFSFPWRERRMEAPDLRVMLVPAQVTAAVPQQQASIEPTVDGGPAGTPSVFSAPILPRQMEAIALKAEATPSKQAEATPTTQAEPAPDAATIAAPAKVPLRTEGSGDAAPPPIPAPVVIAVERSGEATWAVPPPPPAPTPVIAAAPSASSAEPVLSVPRDAGELTQERAEPEVRERAVEVAKPDSPAREAQTQRLAEQLEAARVEAAQLEAARQEAARVEVLRREAKRQEAARLAATQLEAQRQEVARQETARIEAARLEAQRREVVRQAAARIDAARLAAARLETERQEAVRQAAAGQEAARVLAEQEEDARRDARRQAMGRVLNEEAAQREAAATAARSPSTLPFSWSTARRARLWGRTDPNVELVEYAETWARKIQFNTSVDTVREVAKRPHTNPMVTVAIRSDGSVESVTFVLSSGVAEVDEAIRRIVQSHAPYQAFPPELAREVDVIEVRRTWHFDTAIRLY